MMRDSSLIRRQFKHKISTFPGPSLVAPFACVRLILTVPPGYSKNTIDVPVALANLMPGKIAAAIDRLDGTMPFSRMVAELALALLHSPGVSPPPYVARRIDATTQEVFMGFDDRFQTTNALKAAYDIILAIKTHVIDDIDSLIFKIQQTISNNFLKVRMKRAANSLGIPIYPISGADITQFGQGKSGIFFTGSTNQSDSPMGIAIQANKVESNAFVQRLGFPAVVHRVAGSASEAVTMAREIGYPIVLKPLNGAQGAGVTTDIRSDDEVLSAFDAANAVSAKRIIIEKFVEGLEFRLVVVAGRFAWARQRTEAFVRGDGIRTIMQLIEAENHRRTYESDEPHRLITVNAEVIAVLAKQKLSLDDRAAAGLGVRLAPAYTAASGTSADIGEITHPDNREMAETIARCLRLSSAGIDFITQDISRSWRDVACSVIEVNSGPGYPNDACARVALRMIFPHQSLGRIPTILVLSPNAAIAQTFRQVLAEAGLVVGFVARGLVALGERTRTQETSTLTQSVTDLLLDPSCDALIVSCDEALVANMGLPLDRFEFYAIDPTPRYRKDVLALVRRFCGTEIKTAADAQRSVLDWP